VKEFLGQPGGTDDIFRRNRRSIRSVSKEIAAKQSAGGILK
jgi:hypothetical protein